MNRLLPIIRILTALLCTQQGYAQSLPISPASDSTHLQDTVKKSAHELKAVQVSAASAGSLQQSTRAVTVIDAKKYYTRPATVLGLINQSPGVRVRQDGGLGSQADLSINGISGRQVKFFINGIPADFLGAGNRLNIIPVNAIDRIEVYKGVVPIELGSDALGGAVNIVTRQELSSYTDAMYSIGSFNTHKAAINTYRNIGHHLFIRAGGFYNYSDNNYTITADVPDQMGNPVPQKVKRFHDRYRDYQLNAEVGITQQKWADLFSVHGSFYLMDKDVQHNMVMTEPYGAITRQEHTWNAGLRYVKRQLLPRLNLSFFANAALIKEHFIDTSFNAWTWDGKVYERRIAYGEISSSRTNLLFTTQSLVGRLLLDFTADSSNKFSVSLTSSFFTRTGKDSLAEKYYGQNFYGHRVQMQKNTAGLAWQHAFARNITSVTSIKYNSYHANGFTIDNMVFNPAARSAQQWGWNESLKWDIDARWLLKLSYEYATRLPDEMEVFGDFSLVKANPSIQPENSHNLNLMARHNRPGKFSAGINSFFRLTDNIIFLQASPRSSQYQNLLKALSAGVEVEANYQFTPSLSIWANGTFQHIINKSKKENTGNIDDRYYNQRLPNKPFLFANSELQWTRNNLFKKDHTFQCWYGISYVNWFYLYWSNDGRRDTKATIPIQFVQRAGISYAIAHNRAAISAEVHNLSNSRVYDNFNVQLPGRAWNLKCRLFIDR
ncbi:cobalamin receptor protein [Paraflavitalea soli]|uniref:Cobalamin receptor protein n=1 Tax=Paraflavitalea soli TaxID=2315862 RepID=A0A3B7MV13_9BACT|nr:TonB-dependent receptor plug domain-containing protein [Paraflavitalea soli]AXY74281.1 cobalamin receptor protein [Paraflavitalea soli]